MPIHIRALIVVLFLSIIVFAFARKPTATLINQADFTRRRNLWLGLTTVAFVSPNFWVFTLAAGALLLFFRSREPNPVALFFLVLFIVPTGGLPISGMGVINYLFELSYQRLVVLLILFPAFLAIASRNTKLPFGRTTPDKLLALYIILSIALFLRQTTITDTLRQGFYQFIDVFLPYYVISRSLQNTNHFRDALLSLVLAIMLLAMIASFEVAKHWMLYNPLERIFDFTQGRSGYGARAGLVRATASVGPIPLGYLMTIGIGFYLYLQQFIRSKFNRRIGFLLLLCGLLASISRGPWVGAALLFCVFSVIGPNKKSRISKLLIAGLLAFTLASILPGGQKFLDLLPYIGAESEQATITYRERLLDNSLIVIKRHPWFGSVDYLETPEMEAMRQGQHIIDIVNTYIEVALARGIVGFSLFTGFFMVICWGVYKYSKRIPDQTSEEALLGRSLLATLAGILVIIFTVSSISIIPLVYWSVGGIGAAYINMMARLESAKQGSG